MYLFNLNKKKISHKNNVGIKMRLKHGFILLIVTFSMVGVISTIPVHSSTTATGTLQQIKDRGYLLVGADTTYAPFESINPDTNMPEGFDVDLAMIIADSLNVSLHYKTSAWDPIISNLKQSQFDIILSAMTITSERAQEVDFTRWYYISSQAWLVPTANPKGITTEADLNQTGLRIGYQTGTTSDLYVNESLPTAEGHGYADVPTAIQALKNDQLDVVLGDWAVLAKAAHDDTTLAVPGTFSPENFGIAVRQGDTDLLNALNGVLDGLLGTDQNKPVYSDLYNTIYNKWFDVNVDNYTGTVTDAPLPTVSFVYEQPSTPGFELLSLFLLIPVVVIIRKRRNAN